MFLLTGPLGVLPIAYLVVLVALLVRRELRGIVVSLLFATAAITAGIWAINQSLSSTAAIGYLAIPFVGALAGFFGLAFGRWRSSTEPPRRVIAWAGLVGGLVVVSFNVGGGIRTLRKNRVNDEKEAAYSAEIARNKAMIDSALKLNVGREQAYLDSSIRAHMNDRPFLVAALTHDSISPTLLDTLAFAKGLYLGEDVASNPRTASETLVKLYKTAPTPYYFFQALAMHRHTPPEILRQVYRHHEPMGNLDYSFASNPSTPRDILEEIAKSTDPSVIGKLMENPAIDCELLRQIEARIAKEPQSSSTDLNRTRLRELVPQKCEQRATQ